MESNRWQYICRIPKERCIRKLATFFRCHLHCNRLTVNWVFRILHVRAIQFCANRIRDNYLCLSSLIFYIFLYSSKIYHLSLLHILTNLSTCSPIESLFCCICAFHFSNGSCKKYLVSSPIVISKFPSTFMEKSHLTSLFCSPQFYDSLNSILQQFMMPPEDHASIDSTDRMLEFMYLPPDILRRFTNIESLIIDDFKQKNLKHPPFFVLNRKFEYYLRMLLDSDFNWENSILKQLDFIWPKDDKDKM